MQWIYLIHSKAVRAEVKKPADLEVPRLIQNLSEIAQPAINNGDSEPGLMNGI
jgi:hypothetical protein